MRPRKTLGVLTFSCALASLASSVVAQTAQSQHVRPPMASPYAAVAQRIGLTDIDVTYHRPAVKERDVWGQIVPSTGPIWRTGANENTTVTFSTDVTVQGQPLAAGTYGLHSVPGESEWTMIFSNDSDAWGSYAYDEKNDALRVKATPEKAPHQEHFAIYFDAIENDATHLNVHWAEVKVPVKVAIDLHGTVLADLRNQLTGLTQFYWDGWDQAAQYCLNNDINLEEALTWAESSIQAEERFNNLSTKAQLLGKLGREDEVEAVMARAVAIANAGQLHTYGRQLMGKDDLAGASAVFERNMKENPDTWFVTLGPARIQSAKGDFEKAAALMKMAIDRAPANFKGQLQPLLDQLEAGENIN